MQKIRSVKTLASVLKKAPSLVLTTHKNADGDGLGAGLALLLGLRKLKKKVIFRSLEEIDEKYRFLDPQRRSLKSFNPKNIPFHQKPLAAALDTHDFRMLEPFYSFVKAKNIPVLFIDHHALDRSCLQKGDLFFINKEASSMGEMVYGILKALRAPLCFSQAQALYTSIVFDTKSFRFIKNSAASFEICKELLRYIPQAERIHENLSKNLSQKSLGFFKYVSQAEFYKKGALAVLYLSKKDFQKFGAPLWMAYELLEILMNVSSVQTAVLILEDPKEGALRLSFRSLGGDALKMARAFGGGGHAKAAGACVPAASLPAIRKKILSLSN